MVVGGGGELDQDLAHDADPRLHLVGDGKPVEVMDDAAADLAVLPEADARAQEALAVSVPPAVQLVCGPLRLLVGPHAV